MEDTVETRKKMIMCLGLKVVCKTCVDCLMIIQLMAMPAKIMDARLIERTKKVTLGHLDEKTKAWIKLNGKKQYVLEPPA